MAARRGIREGDVVRIFNDRGACLAGAQLSDDIREGVLQLATGAWYDPDRPGAIGSLDRHGNPNVLTSSRTTSSLAQCPPCKATLVEIERLETVAPDVGVFTPPEIRDRAGVAS